MRSAGFVITCPYQGHSWDSASPVASWDVFPLLSLRVTINSNSQFFLMAKSFTLYRVHLHKEPQWQKQETLFFIYLLIYLSFFFQVYRKRCSANSQNITVNRMRKAALLMENLKDSNKPRELAGVTQLAVRKAALCRGLKYNTLQAPTVGPRIWILSSPNFLSVGEVGRQIRLNQAKINPV